MGSIVNFEREVVHRNPDKLREVVHRNPDKMREDCALGYPTTDLVHELRDGVSNNNTIPYLLIFSA